MSLVVATLGCRDSTGPESIVGGIYVLDALDGVQFPVRSPSFAVCPPPLSSGVLDLAPSTSEMTTLYFFSVSLGRACNPTDTRPPAYTESATLLSRDGGNWSVEGERVSFRSSPAAYGLGRYEGTFQATGGSADAPILVFSIGGHTYTWRRVRLHTVQLAALPIAVVDENGLPVNGAVLDFRDADGIMATAVTNNNRPSGTAAPAGMTVTIYVRPPAGYAIPPAQSNPVTAVAGQTTAVTIRLVKSST